MTAATVSVRRVRVEELPEFARRTLGDSTGHAIVPITPRRAEAQARNPAASPDDVGLIVAYLNDRCIGYLGLFAVRLASENGPRKVLSLSTYYVGPEYRSTGAGALLLLDALALGRDLFVAGFSEAAGRVFERVGFRRVGPMTLLNLRIDRGLVLPALLDLAGRFRNAGGTGGMARALDRARRWSHRTFEATLRPLVIRFLLRPVRTAPGDPIVRPVHSVASPDGAADPGKPRRTRRFMRDDAAVNWMIHHPWLSEDRTAPSGYAFSSRRELFRFLPFELIAPDTEHRLGYVVLRVSGSSGGTVVTILDCVLLDERHRRTVLALALREALRWSADHLECGEEFDDLFRSSLVYRALTWRAQRGCLLLTRDRRESISDIEVGICDGDAPFV